MKSNKELFLIIIRKKGGRYILTKVVSFIHPSRNESYNRRNLMDKVVIIVRNKSNIKKIWSNKREHVKGDERGIHDALQINHGQRVDISRYYC